MSELTPARNLIRRAEDDYAIAVAALRRKKPLTYPCAFHSQQCAEKYMKAPLAARDQRYSLVHDLVRLNRECKAAGILLGFSNDDMAILSEYGVKTRYAGDAPTIEEAREARALAKTIRKFVRKYLSIQ